MGDRVNTAQLDRFDRFFDGHYEAMVAEIADNDPSGAVRRTRAGFASAYRFWGKVEDDGDPVGWVRRVIAEDRRSTTRDTGPESADEPGTPASVDSNAERHRVVALARRQRVVASVVLAVGTLVAIGAELFVAHR
jgi:hypothetical protein